MELQSQEKVWDDIAPEWEEFKKIPSGMSVKFLEGCSGNVLDLGGGSGRHMMKLKGKYFIQDISNEMVKLAEKKAKKLGVDFEGIHGSMVNIPKEDEFFDYAICISALHSVEKAEDRKKAVEELYRVLKKDGEAYIGVWNFNSKRFNQKRGKEKIVGWRDKGDRYYYLFDREEVHALFKSVGFEIVSEHSSEMMINFVVKK